MKIDFKIRGNFIVASHITGVYDVNRSTTLADDDFSLVSEWANSITKLGLQGIIFHNNFSELTCRLHQSNHIHFINIEYNPQYSPNVFRYAVYDEFLKQYAEQIENIFFTDISDVKVLKDPFIDPLYIACPGTIFCGDEPEILENDWMQRHSDHLRSKIPDYQYYEDDFKNATLLNCGIIGGNFSVVHPFIDELWNIHQRYNINNKSLFTGDMGAFNFLARTRYQTRLIHGRPVNTEFKSYTADTTCWFKHK
ncbi:hypothetical protein ACVWYG_003387 [Pedobacter sp. UYEF25]